MLTSVTSAQASWSADRDVWWSDAMRAASAECPPVWMDAEEPLFMLYTRSAADGTGHCGDI